MTDTYNEASVISIFRGGSVYNYNSNYNPIYSSIYFSIYNLFCFSFSTKSSIRCSSCGMFID